MGIRKVLNKHYPVDFDYRELSRAKSKGKKQQDQQTVRSMIPFTVQCKTCGHFNGRGTKYNMRKENTEKDYLGIKVLRFYFKCSNCKSEMTLLTDPKDSDYTVELGGKRIGVPLWKQNERIRELAAQDEKAAGLVKILSR
mmetsp:Transcript_13790/g.15222  ORF Transcript_13790/g.15222 Transcript_13790/m.15222 type:complete len:140 (-) Transcript_13790:323-742(-)